MRFVFLCAILLLFAVSGFAQATSATPPPPQPPPASTPRPSSTPVAEVRSLSGSPRFSRAFPLNPVSESDRLARRVVMLSQYVAPLYRKASSKELLAIAPDPLIRQQYAVFISRPGSGIVRLVSDTGCSTNDKVVSARDECLKYSMPGAGSSFSFRSEGYRLRQLADITLHDNSFHITGVFMHGFIGRVEDSSFESLNLATPSINFVSEFKPSVTAKDVHHIDLKLARGISQGGIRFAKSAPVAKNGVYVLRAVAYRGKVTRSAAGIRYNELDYDKREDIAVAFQVVDIGPDGSVTLIWKTLVEKDAPKIKMPEVKEEKRRSLLSDEDEAN